MNTVISNRVLNTTAARQAAIGEITDLWSSHVRAVIKRPDFDDEANAMFDVQGRHLAALMRAGEFDRARAYVKSLMN